MVVVPSDTNSNGSGNRTNRCTTSNKKGFRV